MIRKWALSYFSKLLRYISQKKWQIIYQAYRNQYNIDKTFKFNGNDIKIYGNGNFYALENSYLGAYSSVQVGYGFVCRIGKNVRIARNVSIYTTSVNPDENLDKNPFIKNKNNKSGSVVIGNGVWIGTNVFINPGVTIGDNSVIGANSVVSKNIPPNSIWGGVPAKLIRYKSSHNDFNI